MRFLLTMIGVNAFILTMPLLLLAAAFYGSEDEQWLMGIAFWVTAPFTIALWYILIRFWRRVHELQASGS